MIDLGNSGPGNPSIQQAVTLQVSKAMMAPRGVSDSLGSERATKNQYGLLSNDI